MPQPAEMTVGSGGLALHSTFAVQLPGVSDARLTGAIDRAVRRIEFAAALRHAGRGVAGTTPLIVKVDHLSAPVQSIDEDESYSLHVTSTGAEIDAPNDLGAMHGLETFVQLVQPDGSGYVIPAVTIHDTPRFRWRGLMIDCGRHFEPVSVIKRTLDGMAAVKLNVFHWHLTEDQGFRMQSHVYPKLTELGFDGLFYTQEQAKEIVAYARARGIRVVPEFEMPGHSTAWLVAYPELASGTTPTEIRREFGVSNTAIDPTRDATYVFIDRFLTEMSTIFPDAYVHIGGDETPAPDWKTNPRILAFMKAHHLKDNEALQAYFNSRVLKILTRLHKHMMGWDEILTPTLPKDIVVQSWRGEASLSKGAKEGYAGILSAPYYLDGMKPAGVHYLADPIPSGSDLTPAEQKLILGGEVCMWGEQLDARTIDSRIWPRTAAIAERFWSPANVRDVNDMYRRLIPVSIELEGLGLTHISYEDAALRNLAGTENIDVLRTFASVFEPVPFHDRYQGQHTDQLTPLDGFVDAVRPDPPSRHNFELAVTRLLANPKEDTADRVALDAWFKQLANVVPQVQQQFPLSPRLAVVSTRAAQLTELTAMGQQALAYLAKGEKAPADWTTEQTNKLDEIKKPSALIRFTILDGMNELIQAASGVGQPQTTGSK
ncbi:family 20 glycosylhydrolase [Granulicella sp. 5B5]|nr:family 20 glycosylhydrolase [Granulicella sp. 5B5]